MHVIVHNTNSRGYTVPVHSRGYTVLVHNTNSGVIQYLYIIQITGVIQYSYIIQITIFKKRVSSKLK